MNEPMSCLKLVALGYSVSSDSLPEDEKGRVAEKARARNAFKYLKKVQTGSTNVLATLVNGVQSLHQVMGQLCNPKQELVRYVPVL